MVHISHGAVQCILFNLTPLPRRFAFLSLKLHFLSKSPRKNHLLYNIFDALHFPSKNSPLLSAHFIFTFVLVHLCFGVLKTRVPYDESYGNIA